MFRILCIFAIWIGWSSYHPIRGRSVAPSIISMTDVTGSSYMAYLNKNGNRINLGTFYSVEEAFLAYKQAKESYIKDLATQYYNDEKITKKVYDALMRYEVEITD